MNVVRFVFLLLAWCALAAPVAHGERIAKTELGDLRLEFVELATATERPGATVLLEATTLPGDVFQLRLPFRPNRISPLVPQGEFVTADTPVARLAGPELGIWLARADALLNRFVEVQTRYDSNLPLYQQQALSAARWSEIADEYLVLQAQVLHAEYVLETLRRVDTDPPEADLLAHVNGRIRFAPPVADGGEEWVVATLIADDALRLTGRIAAATAGDIVAVKIESCRVSLSHLDLEAVGLYRQLWTQPVQDCAAVRPGALLPGRVLHAFDGYSVPRPALLRAGGQSGIVLDDSDDLEFVPVRVISESPQRFFFEADRSLAGRSVLVRSVSAVQGLLLGLGDD